MQQVRGTGPGANLESLGDPTQRNGRLRAQAPPLPFYLYPFWRVGAIPFLSGPGRPRTASGLVQFRPRCGSCVPADDRHVFFVECYERKMSLLPELENLF